MELPYYKNNGENEKLLKIIKRIDDLCKNQNNINKSNLYNEVNILVDQIFSQLDEIYNENPIQVKFVSELKLESKKLIKQDLNFILKSKKNEINYPKFFELDLSSFSLFLIKFILKGKIKSLKKNVQLGYLKREDLSVNNGLHIGCFSVAFKWT